MEVQSGRVELLDFQTGRRWPTHSTNAGALAVRFSPNGKQLAVAGSEQPGVRVYEVDSGQLVVSLPHSNAVRRLDWSPDGRWLAAPCADGRVFVWDMSEGPILHRIVEAHDAVVTAVCFDPQGEFLLSQSWDGTTALWSLPLCNLILKCPGSAGPMSFSKDGRWLGPCVIGQTIQLLEVVRAPHARMLPANLVKTACNGAFSPDGHWVVLGGDNLQCWEVSSARRVWVEPLGNVPFVTFRPDGKLLLTKEESGTYERDWSVDALTGVPRLGPPKRLPVGQWGGGAQYSEDGSVLAIAQREGLWISRTGASQPALFPPTNCCFVAVSPDGRWAAAANWFSQPEMRVWELSSGREVYHITNANPSVAFTSDSRFLVKFWSEATECLEVGTWRSVARVTHRITPATSVAISPRNHWVAFHDKGSNVVQLSELPTLRPILTLSDTVEALAFSPDDSLLLTRRLGGQVCIWDLRGIRKELEPLGLGW
jgi:WD40 repeat protein